MEYLQYKTTKTFIATRGRVLNLVISGIPSILDLEYHQDINEFVLNLIINGLPSILELDIAAKSKNMF